MIRWPGVKIEPFVRIGQPAGSNRVKLGIAASVAQSARKLPLLLRKESKTLAQYGSTALHSKEGARNQRSHPPDTRAHVGTDRQFDPLAVADRSDFLRSMLFREFNLFARQRDSDRWSLDRSAFGLDRNFFDIGIESLYLYLGLMRISGAPLRNALAQIGQ
jgi:hypothetical protein